MHGQAWRFALLTGGRATAQVGLMAALVLGGYGVSGVLAAGAVAGLLLAGVLTAGQARQTGIGFELRATGALLGYGLPLVGGGLAAFVLGTADRWFLAGQVPAAALGWYGLAMKIALIVPLLAQPFELWWYPRRLGVLAGPDGRAASSRVVMAGMAGLLLAGGAVALAAPGMVALLAPASYAPAAAMVPPLALALVLQLASSMANVGCYARKTGTQALLVNLAAAAVALAGYALLIPGLGVTGAIVATVLSQAVRFVLFAGLSQRTAPLDWKLPQLAVLAGAVMAAVMEGGFTGGLLLAGAAALVLPLGLARRPHSVRLAAA
jgi:O-antigen/teichoic acid export membrane protein